MRMKDIIGIVRDNFSVAIMLVAILSVLFVVGYFLIYKKFLKGDKNLSKLRVFIWLCFIGYITMIIGVTFIGRGVRLYGDSNFHFLSTYREAWNSFSFSFWSSLILNIIMFIPLGILLPLMNNRFYKFRWTFGASFLLTLMIETIQLLTGYGIFDVDDIFNNMLGAIIGYGIFMAIRTFVKDKENRFKKSTVYLIPLIGTIVLSVTVASVYNSKEFGNVFIAHNYKINMKNIDLSLNTEINKDDKEVFLNENYKYNTGKVPIYKAEIYDNSYGEEFFKSFLKDKEIDEAIEVDLHGDMSIYWYRDKGYNMWFYYNGGGYNYSDFSSHDEGLEKADIDKKTVLEKLAEHDISIPKSATFTKSDDANQTGVFQWSVENYIEGDYIINGGLSAEYYSYDTIKAIRNNIVKYKKIKDVSIKSIEEAYKELEQGEFRIIYTSDDISKIEIKDINLSYMLDTKGFYQPIYNFESKIDGQDLIISIPAL